MNTSTDTHHSPSNGTSPSPTRADDVDRPEYFAARSLSLISIAKGPLEEPCRQARPGLLHRVASRGLVRTVKLLSRCVGDSQLEAVSLTRLKQPPDSSQQRAQRRRSQNRHGKQHGTRRAYISTVRHARLLTYPPVACNAKSKRVSHSVPLRPPSISSLPLVSDAERLSHSNPSCRNTPRTAASTIRLQPRFPQSLTVSTSIIDSHHLSEPGSRA